MVAVCQTDEQSMARTETSAHRFPQRISVRVPAGLLEAVETAARRRFSSPSEWARQALLRSLAADGVRINEGRAEIIDLRGTGENPQEAAPYHPDR